MRTRDALAFFILGWACAITPQFLSKPLSVPDKKPVKLYIQDWTTGCEYIQNPNGGITPRIDVDLMHKGCKSLQGEADNNAAP